MSNLQPIEDRIPTSWGKVICTPKAWDEIILDLNEKLAAIYPTYEVHQVKSKFGGLRYYTSVDDMPRAQILIREAEAAVDALEAPPERRSD